ncbi:MAG: sterol carrier protein domain-containing protein, partial [Actinobacteria bacterium]|nr:sterol carrier protein domain-containing protein [Actinomycetota bacterium]
GAVYLGGFGFRDLHRAGRIAERSEGAIRRADALFATDRAPYCPEIF